MNIERLKMIMEKKSLTPAMLARMTDIPKGTISRLLNGLRTDPHISTLIKIADALGVTIDEIAR